MQGIQTLIVPLTDLIVISMTIMITSSSADNDCMSRELVSICFIVGSISKNFDHASFFNNAICLKILSITAISISVNSLLKVMLLPVPPNNLSISVKVIGFEISTRTDLSNGLISRIPIITKSGRALLYSKYGCSSTDDMLTSQFILRIPEKYNERCLAKLSYIPVRTFSSSFVTFLGFLKSYSFTFLSFLDSIESLSISPLDNSFNKLSI